ncbi:probable RNA-binding protein EIF1AD isoform X2 [Montipora capricornis]|uniref:probable RNA-binding protein EIF1AD isoform X2 n=1 Tax=Montipora capricornis TaxID=246305 RepID=UPI0035F155A8
MSKATKRKHVAKEVLEDYVVPDPNQQIVKVVSSRGNNLHEIETSDGNKFLVSMPSKFRKSVWIKRGDFVIVDPIKEGNKVCAEIVYILYGKQIKYLKSEGLWPKAFTEEFSLDEKSEVKEVNSVHGDCKDEGGVNNCDTNSDDEEDEDDDDLFVNPNHQKPTTFIDTDSSEDDDDGL